MKINAILTIVFFCGLLSFSRADSLSDLSASINQVKNSLNSISWVSNVTNVQYTSDGVNLNNYMYRDAVIYDNIFSAYQNKIFEKLGSPAGWDETSYATTLWNNRRILKIGAGVQTTNNNGIVVHVPSGYNVLWIRVLNDRWETFRVMSAVQTDTVTAIYAGGQRSLNEISPDGGTPDVMYNFHIWMPIPLYFSGDYWVFSDANSDDWISGIAFGKNLWNHAMNSAVAYYWYMNGGSGVSWYGLWNNDHNGQMTVGIINVLYVPVVPSGKNKLLYIVDHNNNWACTMHSTVTVNDQQIERFRTTYSNPFAQHYSSKFYQRYIAAMVPASLIPANAKFIKVSIDMTKSDMHMYFREIGTHDYF